MLIEDGHINYNGLKAPLARWDVLTHFDPPKKMLVAVDHLDYAQVINVYAYDPANAKGAVITERGAFTYCAEVPSWDFKAVCAYILDRAGSLVVEENGLLYYAGPGRDYIPRMKNVIANGVCIYPNWSMDESHISYDVLSDKDVKNLVKAIKDFNELHKVRRCTHRELAQWLAQGNGEYKGDTGTAAYHFPYEESLAGKELSVIGDGHIRIRKWGDIGWHEPTTDYMGLDRAQKEASSDDPIQ